MKRIPKSPLGFIPVDSEEAKQFDVVPTHTVNVAFLKDGVWIHGRDQYCNALHLKTNYPNAYQHLHIQLPPKVEWEEVWGLIGHYDGQKSLRKNGQHMACIDIGKFTEKEMDTIVAALNQMEVGNEH